jgi:hypothetical protein
MSDIPKECCMTNLTHIVGLPKIEGMGKNHENKILDTDFSYYLVASLIDFCMAKWADFRH